MRQISWSKMLNQGLFLLFSYVAKHFDVREVVIRYELDTWVCLMCRILLSLDNSY